MTVLVVAEGVARTFGEGTSSVVAVHDVSFVLEAGARVALVGSSGSGKSTLVHLLAGLDRPTVGTISWPGLGGHPRAARAGSVGVVFQGPSLLPALDVLENVALPLLLASASDEEARERALAALEALGLLDIAGHLPEEISGGQMQRVAVARALVTGPTLIVADEPTGQLDHAAAAVVVDALETAAITSQATLLVSTHDSSVAERFERRWSMVDGRLRTDAP